MTDVEAWIGEARRDRERRYEHGVLTGTALRAELDRCRAIGLEHRKRRRLELAAARARAANEEGSGAPVTPDPITNTTHH